MFRYVILALIILFVLPTSAFANTTYTFSGQMCQPDYNDEVAWEYSSNGSLNNSSTNSYDITGWCPVGGIESTTVNLENAYVYYLDQQSEAEISCTMYVRNSTGTIYQSSSLGSGVANTGYGTITFTGAALPNAGGSISNVRTYAFYCTIPSRNRLDGSNESNSYLRGYAVEQVSP